MYIYGVCCYCDVVLLSGGVGGGVDGAEYVDVTACGVGVVVYHDVAVTGVLGVVAVGVVVVDGNVVIVDVIVTDIAVAVASGDIWW